MNIPTGRPATGALPAAVQRLFDARRQSVHGAREFTAAVVADWGLGCHTDDVRLCVSELASNALAHGTRPGHTFLVRLDADGTRLRLEVHDSRGRREGPVPAVRHPAADETAGRGLLIVAALADAWGVDERDVLGKVVWAEFRRRDTD